jgi:ferredoxin
MKIKKSYAIYFSPTGTTEKVATGVAKGLGYPFEKIDLTLPKARQAFSHFFDEDEVAVVGLPVYGGRLPKYLDDFFSCLKSDNACAVALVMYGNREYDDALIELKLKLEERGFTVKAGAAFIGEHTYSKKIATGRPDTNDLAIADSYGQQVAELLSQNKSGTLNLKGNYPFVAKGSDPSNNKNTIVTTELCTKCGLCAENCPWQAIDVDSPGIIDYAKCLRCWRCIKNCPNSAKQYRFADDKSQTFFQEFEKRLSAVRKEPEIFLVQ